ncbi:MAG TPA: TonB-dependent receptor plug domain-containing protein, partial [Flavisolibacter sp.]|nr:TonB-dependent receptor plug domain-containing protein [Flavisolibacter sp.]
MKYRNQKFHSLLLWLTGLCLLMIQQLSAQPGSSEINGSIKTEEGLSLEGVSIVAVAGNQRSSAISGGNGNFTLKNLTVGKTYTITFTSVGYQPQVLSNVLPTINPKTLNITLKPTTASMENVVVTALGIKREEKALGYATTTLKGEQLTDALSNNWKDALSGKVAGLNLLRSNAGPMGGSKVILRGESNLTGDNEALIVIDGVIINSGSGRRSGESGAVYGTGSDNMPVDYGSSMDDINPEDIENITVLKGPGAAALYGQRAANGAIIITTKSGSRKGKGIGVTLNSNAAFESVNRWPDLQYEYGQGLNGAAHYSFGAGPDGASTSGTSSAYGPRFDGQSFYQYDPVTQAQAKERTPWVPFAGSQGVKGFFETGKTLTNTVTIDGGTDRTSARFSFTNVNNTWITPNTGYKRNSVALSVNSKVTDKLTI